MINIVDATMGMGKTQAAINYINNNKDRKFIYVTPYIEETHRIKDACPELDFEAPRKDVEVFNFRKRDHLAALVKSGRNISMTHALFSMIDNSLADSITSQGYIIIIDEVIDVFKKRVLNTCDISLLASGGFLEEVQGDDGFHYYKKTGTSNTYDGRLGGYLAEIGSGEYIRLRDNNSGQRETVWFWSLNERLFRMSDEVYILTYLFDGMPIKGFMDMHRIPYRYIGVEHDETGYHFSDRRMLPAYAGNLRSLIHICNKDSINDIGKAKCALSSSWYKRAKTDGSIMTVRNHLNTYFQRHIPKWVAPNQRLWSVFKSAEPVVKYKGFTKGFLSYTARATNKYSDAIAVAYCVNIFADPTLARYLQAKGASIDQDKYALAYMLQWVWRSRIRNGQEIWLYIPSGRMRELFIKWMDDIEKQYLNEREVVLNGSAQEEG